MSVRIPCIGIDGKLTVQPTDILLLLLESNVVGDHVLELEVQTTLLEVAAPESNQLRVKVLSRGAGVKALASPVLLSSVGIGDFGVGEVGDLLDLEVAVLDNGLDEESTVVGLLDGDVEASGEGRRENFVLALGLVLLGLILALVAESLVGQVVHRVLGQVVDVGNGEGDADAVQDAS